jgi:hypothetical protein
LTPQITAIDMPRNASKHDSVFATDPRLTAAS